MNKFDQIAIIVLASVGVFFVVDALFYGFCFKKVFEKAKYKPGDAFIPLLNLYRITQIAGFPGWLALIILVFSFPGILIWRVIIAAGLYNAFKPAPVVGVLMVLSLPIGCLILGSSECNYLLDEEEIAKMQTKGFSSDEGAKKWILNSIANTSQLAINLKPSKL